MKHLLYSCALGLLSVLFACNRLQQSKTDTTDTLISDTGTTASLTDSLDRIIGTFNGVLPCEGCELGMATGIMFEKDKTYIKSDTLENNDVHTETGTWTFDGNILTLQSQGQADSASTPDQYRIGENQIALIDEEGNDRTAENGEAFVLLRR